MAKNIEVEEDHDDGYNVILGKSTFHVHATRNYNLSQKSFKCPVHGFVKGPDKVCLIGVDIEDEIIDADTNLEVKDFTLREIIKRAVKLHLKAGQLKCIFCDDEF